MNKIVGFTAAYINTLSKILDDLYDNDYTAYKAFNEIAATAIGGESSCILYFNDDETSYIIPILKDCGFEVHTNEEDMDSFNKIEISWT